MGLSREDVITAWRDKNKAADLSNAKAKAVDKLKDMSQSEKMALSKVSEAVKATSVEKVYEMLNIISISKTK